MTLLDNSDDKNEKNSSRTGLSRTVVVDLGIRSVHEQHSSKIITLPKTAWENLGRPSKVKIRLLADKRMKCLILIPLDSSLVNTEFDTGFS